MTIKTKEELEYEHEENKEKIKLAITIIANRTQITKTKILVAELLEFIKNNS